MTCAAGGLLVFVFTLTPADPVQPGGAEKLPAPKKSAAIDPLPLPVAPTVYGWPHFQPPWPYWWWGAYLYRSEPLATPIWVFPPPSTVVQASARAKVVVPLREDGPALYTRAESLYLRKRYAEAAKALAEAVKRQPAEPRYWLFKGLAERASGNEKAGRASIQTGLTDQDYMEVMAGLTDRDSVLVPTSAPPR